MGGEGSGRWPRLSAAELVARGTFRQDRHSARVAAPVPSVAAGPLPSPPHGLSSAARAHRRRLVAALGPAARAADAPLLALAAIALADLDRLQRKGSDVGSAWRRAFAGLKALGLVAPTRRAASAPTTAPTTPVIDLAKYADVRRPAR